MSKGDYEVGYRRPPIHSRFTKGHSGNPRGRRRGSKNLATILARELDRPVTVNLGGRRKTMKVREALAVHAVNQAVAGSMRHFELLLRFSVLEPQAETQILWLDARDLDL